MNTTAELLRAAATLIEARGWRPISVYVLLEGEAHIHLRPAEAVGSFVRERGATEDKLVWKPSPRIRVFACVAKPPLLETFDNFTWPPAEASHA